MDGPGRDVAAFLETLQVAMDRLGTIRNLYSRRGTRPGRPSLTLSERPFSVHEAGSVRQFDGCVTVWLPITGSDAREYELGVNIRWDERCWTITTEAWVDAEEGGQHLLRELPERPAVDLATCLEQIGAAVEDLASFEDLVPGK
jgi:hypothetical protein